MIVFVHQPEYIPWLGFFDKLARCDTYVIYDDAQYQHGGFHNRNRIRTTGGWNWLTVPIIHNHPQTIKDTKIAGEQWKTRQLALLTDNYKKTPYFKDYFPIIKEAITFNHELLIGLNLHLIKAVAELLDIKAKMMRSSEFPYCGKEKNEKLVSMCRFLGADTYLCGSGGRNYVDQAQFEASKITLQWHSYEHPTYRQRYEGFQPNMSIVDLLFNHGAESKEILLKGGNISEKIDPQLNLSEALIINQPEALAKA
ncbi:MAG: WbqC family protein [Candidatus Bathyarchaeota archaeon]|nr:WbqC family protein [Candidatus Bathyarchaeota archaeon]